MRTDLAAVAAARVPGLNIRPYAGEADLAEIARVRDAEWEADGIPERTSIDDLRVQWGHPSTQFDAARDVWIGELEGHPVGVVQVDWVDATDGTRVLGSRGWVHPTARRRGIGTALLAWTEARRSERAEIARTDRPILLGMGTADSNAGARALAERSGYRPVRWFADMDRPLVDEPLPEVSPLPDGLEVRPTVRDDARTIWDADHEAFLDHWGGFDASEASFRGWLESSEFQPDLMVVAWDGDEIAGAVLNTIYRQDNRATGVERGWLDSVFTRRRWRRRGLARALIVRSLHVLRDSGMTVASLGVDADNPSGAWGLYESAGFRPTARFTAWRKPVEVDR